MKFSQKITKAAIILLALVIASWAIIVKAQSVPIAAQWIDNFADGSQLRQLADTQVDTATGQLVLARSPIVPSRFVQPAMQRHSS